MHKTTGVKLATRQVWVWHF